MQHKMYTGQPHYIVVPRSHTVRLRYSLLRCCRAELALTFEEKTAWYAKVPRADVSLAGPHTNVRGPAKADVNTRNPSLLSMLLEARDLGTLFQILQYTEACNTEADLRGQNA